MNYLKSYNESLFDFFRKKKKQIEPEPDNKEFLNNHLDDVEDCFLELTLQDLNVNVVLANNTEIHVEIWRWEFSDDPGFIQLEDLMETFRFANSYLTELGLKINRYELRIFGDYDGETYIGDIYYDSIKELERDLDKEGTKHIEGVLIRIVKV